LGREFVIKTDHKPLKHLLEQRLYTEAQRTWLLKLHNCKFVVQYKKGKENLAADGLSRREGGEDKAIWTLIAVESSWMEQVKTMVLNDDYFQELNANRSLALWILVRTKRGEIFYYKNKVLFNPSSPLTHLLISEHMTQQVEAILDMRRHFR